MIAPNGGPPPAPTPVPSLIILPPGITSAKVFATAQWHTDAGILCPPQSVPVVQLDALGIGRLFVNLINQGLVKQKVKDADGKETICDLPKLNFHVVEPTEQPPANRIIMP